MICFDTYESSVGRLCLASDGTHLCGLWMEGQKYYQDKLAQRLGLKTIDTEPLQGLAARRQAPVLEEARQWLTRYFAGDEPLAMPAICLRGTAFQQEVWSALQQIPYGTLTTYGAIARQIAEKRGTTRVSARAVGAAVGRNPVSILVPCHRVVGANHSLTGYAGGMERKLRLLAIEGVDVSHLAAPGHGTAL